MKLTFVVYSRCDLRRCSPILWASGVKCQ